MIIPIDEYGMLQLSAYSLEGYTIYYAYDYVNPWISIYPYGTYKSRMIEVHPDTIYFYSI